MPTIEQLKRELAKEKAYDENKREIEQIGREKTKLKKELFKRRMIRQNPWLRTVGRIGKVAGRGLGKLADTLEKSAKINEELRKKKLHKQIKRLKKTKTKKRTLPKATINAGFDFY